MGETQRAGGSRAWRIGMLLLVAAVLAAAAFWLRGTGNDASAEPLFPNDVLSTWHRASPARKRATAERLLDQMQHEGILGPATEAQLERPGGRDKLLEELIATLDVTGHRNKEHYAPPSQSLLRTAGELAETKGWNQ